MKPIEITYAQSLEIYRQAEIIISTIRENHENGFTEKAYNQLVKCIESFSMGNIAKHTESYIELLELYRELFNKKYPNPRIQLPKAKANEMNNDDIIDLKYNIENNGRVTAGNLFNQDHLVDSDLEYEGTVSAGNIFKKAIVRQVANIIGELDKTPESEKYSDEPPFDYEAYKANRRKAKAKTMKEFMSDGTKEDKAKEAFQVKYHSKANEDKPINWNNFFGV